MRPKCKSYNVEDCQTTGAIDTRHCTAAIAADARRLQAHEILTKQGHNMIFVQGKPSMWEFPERGGPKIDPNILCSPEKCPYFVEAATYRAWD